MTKAGSLIFRVHQLVSISQFAVVVPENCERGALHSPQRDRAHEGTLPYRSFRRRESQLVGPKKRDRAPRTDCE